MGIEVKRSMMKETEKEGRVMKNIIAITDESGGFCSLAARAVAYAGHAAYASMRKTTGRNAHQVKEVEEYATAHAVDLLHAIELDVSSQESLDATVNTIIITSENSHLNVVIHNAGHIVFGPTEAFAPEQSAQLYDRNVLLMQRVNRAALSYFCAQGKGVND